AVGARRGRTGVSIRAQTARRGVVAGAGVDRHYADRPQVACVADAGGRDPAVLVAVSVTTRASLGDTVLALALSRLLPSLLSRLVLSGLAAICRCASV